MKAGDVLNLATLPGHVVDSDPMFNAILSTTPITKMKAAASALNAVIGANIARLANFLCLDCCRTIDYSKRIALSASDRNNCEIVLLRLNCYLSLNRIDNLGNKCNCSTLGSLRCEAKLGMDTKEASFSSKYELTYVFSFFLRRERKLLEQMMGFGWISDPKPYSNDDAFRVSRYFSSTVAQLYLSDSRYFKLDRFSNVSVIESPKLKANIKNCSVVFFPSLVGQLILSLKIDDSNVDLYDLCDLHESLRAWSNSYSIDGHPKGASSLKFDRTDDGSCEYFEPDEFDASPDLKVSSLLSFLLGAHRSTELTIDRVLEPICDRRSPALIYVSGSTADVVCNEKLYKLLVGDGQNLPLPTASYMRAFIKAREASPYFGKDVLPRDSSRSVIDGYGFILIGNQENRFFSETVYSSFQSIYLILFSLLWYQYAFLFTSLERIEKLSEASGEPHSRDVEKIIKEIGTHLNPSILSFGSREEQAIMLMEIGQRALGIDRLYEKLDRQTAYWHNYSVTVETRSTANAAVVIGLLSVIGLVVSVLFGVADLDVAGASKGNPLVNMLPTLTAISVAGLLVVLALGFFSRFNPKGSFRSIAVFYVLPYIGFLLLFTLAVLAAVSV